MAINPTQITVENLFGTKKYYVDFYQRDYKWNDNSKSQSYKPIRSLLDDIFYRFDLNYKNTSDINEESISKYDWYYLNSFMTNTVGGNTYIVDGQQRLTTLTVLTICLLKIGEKLGVDPGKQRYLEKKICDYDANGKIVFWMGFDDRVKALKTIYESKFGQEIEISSLTNVSEKNIIDAYKTILSYLGEKLDNLHIFNAFRFYLYQRVYLISIDVDESKDVAMAFEVINDRGIPLRAYEILKGKILGVIDKTEVSSYVQKWEDAVNQIANSFGDDEVDEFFSTFFQSRYAETLLQYREFQKDRYHKTIYLEEYNTKIGLKYDRLSSEKSIQKIKHFVDQDLPFYSNLYLQLLRDSQESKSENNYAWFNKINEQDSQFYLLLSAIKLNDSELKEKYLLITREFDKLYTVSNLMGSYQSNVFANDIVELGKSIRDKSCEEIKNEFSSTLKKIISKAHNRSDISEEFKYELFSSVGYSNLGQRFLRYFFARIDHFIADECSLSTDSYITLISKIRGKDACHVEHILAHDSENQNKNLFRDEEEFNVQRNRLGGLLLLKGRDNQSSGNELYEEKLKTYSGNGTLFAQTLRNDFDHSNTGFRDFCKKYDLKFKTYEKYGGNAIEERQRLLFEMVKLIWK